MEQPRHLLTRAALLAALLIFSFNASALPMGYAVDNQGDFYSIDLSSGVSTFIGATGIASPDTELVEGLAMNTGGQLYATTSLGMLYSVNSATGAFTAIGDTGRGNIEGLDFRGGELLGSEFLSIQDVFSIDLGSAATTGLVTVDRGDIQLISAMAVLDANTALFAGTLTPGTSTLFSLDLGSGTTTLIGDLASFVAGLDFARDGTLYGVGNAGSVSIIDPATAVMTSVGSTGNQFWLALTTYSVPTPGAGALLLLGLAGLMAARPRRS